MTSYDVVQKGQHQLISLAIEQSKPVYSSNCLQIPVKPDIARQNIFEPLQNEGKKG
jgi:hypothetical protein